MGKIKNLQLIYENIPIFAGQILCGAVTFTVKDVVNVKNIVLLFCGNSKVNAGENSTARKSANEQWYFQIEIPLAGYLLQFGTFNGTKQKVPRGDHIIPFRFPIPLYAPNSFGGKHGYVCYTGKVTVSGTGSEIHAERLIPVIGIEDLNWYPAAATPLCYHEGYRKNILCLNWAHVDAVLYLSKSAFVPGESMNINAEIVNRSQRKKVKRTTFQIVQTVQYISGDRSKKTQEVIAQLSQSEIPPGEMRKLEDEPLYIPPVPPSFLRGCDNIHISYDFVFVVDPGIRIEVPILIGTIPYLPGTNLKVVAPVRALTWPSDKPQPKTRRKFSVKQDRGPRKNVPPRIFVPPPPFPAPFNPRCPNPSSNFGPMPHPEGYCHRPSKPTVHQPPSEISENESSHLEESSNHYYSQCNNGDRVLKIEEITDLSIEEIE